MPSIQFAPMVGYPNPATTNPVEGTCTCPVYLSEGYCKHLEMLGVYLIRNWTQKTCPTFSQALSGLVKALRLRRVQDSVYWLVYLDTFKEPGMRFRVARRLLIGSSEDGHSVAVMERVAKQFKHNCDVQTHLCHLVADAVRICDVPNWWNPETGGHDYIYHGMLGDRGCSIIGEEGRELEHLPLEELKARQVKAIDSENMPNVLTYIHALCNTRQWGRTALVTWLMTLAVERDCKEAIRLLEIHLTFKSPLSGDSNFLMQAVWWMAGGYSPVAEEIHTVKSATAVELYNNAVNLWKNPIPIPGWCCDGIHCGGTDRRFAGLWQDMYAVCLAYNHYGTVCPDKEWLQEFHPTDGLPLL